MHGLRAAGRGKARARGQASMRPSWKLCRGEGLDDMIAPQSALSTKRKQSVGPNVARSVLITLDIGHCRLRCALPVLTLCQPARRVEFVHTRRDQSCNISQCMNKTHTTKKHMQKQDSAPANGNRLQQHHGHAQKRATATAAARKLAMLVAMKALAVQWRER
jgi:hypothetical protein